MYLEGIVIKIVGRIYKVLTFNKVTVKQPQTSKHTSKIIMHTIQYLISSSPITMI